MPSSAASFCVYSFTCSCGACYIGRTTRHLSVRAREHHPVWLSSGITKSIKSSVLAHLVDTGHTIDIKQSFQPIYRVKGNQSKLIRNRILVTAEAIGIRLFNPLLCAQKQLDPKTSMAQDIFPIHTKDYIPDNSELQSLYVV